MYPSLNYRIFVLIFIIHSMRPKKNPKSKKNDRQLLVKELMDIYHKLKPSDQKKMENNFRKLIPSNDSEVKISISYSYFENNIKDSEHTFSFDVTNNLHDDDMPVLKIIERLFEVADDSYFEGFLRSVKILKNSNNKYQYSDFQHENSTERFNYYQFRIY